MTGCSLAAPHATAIPLHADDDDLERDAAQVTLQIVPAGSQSTRLFQIAAEDGRHPALAFRLSEKLRAHGFVTVRASATSPDEAPLLLHRHLCVFGLDDADRLLVCHWVRRLTHASPRAHIILLFDRRQQSVSPGLKAVVRERAPLWQSRGEDVPPPNPPGDARLVRAARLAARGRHADAERWFVAALESARRRGDEHALASSCTTLVRWLRCHDRWSEADQRTRKVLAAARDPAARSALAVLRAEVLIARARFDEAESVLAGASIEAAAGNQPASVSVSAALAELRFWQGRLDEVETILEQVGPHVIGLTVRGLVAWLRRDGPALERIASALDPGGSASAATRRATLDVLSAALKRDPPVVAVAAANAERAAAALSCPRLSRFTRALTAEALSFVGMRDEARPPTRASVRSPEFDRLLSDWWVPSHAGHRDMAAHARGALERAGAEVVRVWRWGCDDMHLVQSIPLLLQVVQEAEDDLSALLAACGWIRRESGAVAAAFLDIHFGTVASDGWTTADTAVLEVEPRIGTTVGDLAAAGPPGDLVAVAPVRYADVRTGMVVVRGPAARRRALVEAAEATAAVCGPALRARIDLLSSMRRAPSLAGEILGRSPAIAALRETIAKTAATPFAVLVEGESGTGKELVARAIHRLSPRRDRRFAAVNSAAFTDELIEAELFGHSRGAFTGAVAMRPGLFEDAHGGSLFLDEVGELSLRAQAKLLRVLQEREIRRVGENAARPVDVRVVAATNRSLSDAVRQGTFREDLLFRLAVVRIRLPALRERLEDIPLLAHAFWRSLLTETGKRAALGPDALARLCRHHWPGNVRELQNAMASLVINAPDRGRVGARHVDGVLASAADLHDAPPLPLERVRTDCERTAILGALARHSGRRTPAARDLGISRQGLTKAMKRLGLSERHDESGVA